jgi:CubicO group peptidase (beta-lactamase class C family)
MTAGFNYDLGAPYIKEALAEGRTSTLELVKALAKTPLGFEPGTRYRYSLCHDILGGLIEVWSGMSLGEYMKKNIFDVLGMENTFFGVPTDEERLSRMAVRYNHGKDRRPERMKLECPYNLSPEYESGGAGLTSCPEDYAIFLDALANGGVGKNGGRILSRASIELMSANHMNNGQLLADFQSGHVGKGYGYGYAVRTHYNNAVSGSLSAIGEFGWDGAAGAMSLVDPQNKLSFVYFQHIHGWDPRKQKEMRNVLYSCID